MCGICGVHSTKLPPDRDRLLKMRDIIQYRGPDDCGIFMEDEIGRVMPGMRADLTVLDANPLEVDPSRLTEIRVRQTIVGGRVVFQAE